MDARNRLFGAAPSPRRAPPGAQAPPQQVAGGQADPPRGYEGKYSDGYGDSNYSGNVNPGPRTPYDAPTQHSRMSGRIVRLEVQKIDGNRSLQDLFIFGNLAAVSPNDFPPNRDGSDLYVKLTGPHMPGDFVVACRPLPGFPDGKISLNDRQRKWLEIGLRDQFQGELYDPFSQGKRAYLGSMDVEVGFASRQKFTETPYDQDELAAVVAQTFQNQVFAPGQLLLMDYKNIPLSLAIKTVQLVDLSMGSGNDGAQVSSNPQHRGILTGQTSIAFFKDTTSPIRLKASSKRAAVNSIVAPDFKFEDMGIGGLDNEFQVIFRRAFASRVFPPGLIEQLGIRHVKGILLYGPPGTGKTLIARQIGKMLNAREPKVVNGPEILNKYVGQSEENVRKLFADAEKEYKEKGEESGLHIIIFDEFDAICKRRGSGSGGGTGVGDTVVNQLLSKIDGVDQLNNVLIIGMTNRKDLIDEALLRPGRLEVQVEISLPDESGRLQILKIHTAKMREHKLMESDVNLPDLAAVTKNFSGAEISGLVNAATSYAFTRHTKGGTMAAVEDNVDKKLKVNKADFENALNDVQSAYGVSNEGLESAVEHGIIVYSDSVRQSIQDGLNAARTVKDSGTRLLTVLLYGPKGAGKTALAAEIAKKADYPFVKMITPEFLVGFRDELGKKERVHEVFTDAYKSKLSLLILDDIESLIEWNPVGPRFSNTIQQALSTLVKASPPKGHRLLILATTSQISVLNVLGMSSAFDKRIPVPAVQDVRELANVLQAFEAFESQADFTEALNLVQSQAGPEIGVGIKTILKTAEFASRAESGQRAQQFADELTAHVRMAGEGGQ